MKKDFIVSKIEAHVSLVTNMSIITVFINNIQLAVVLQNQEYLIICLSIDHDILSLMNWKK